jgi:hypothetical protein
VELAAALDLIALAALVYWHLRLARATRGELASLVQQQRRLEEALDEVDTSARNAKVVAQAIGYRIQDAEERAVGASRLAEEALSRPSVVVLVTDPADPGAPPRRSS